MNSITATINGNTASDLQTNDMFQLPGKRRVEIVRKVVPFTHHRTNKPMLLIMIENCRQVVISPDDELTLFRSDPKATDAEASGFI